MKPICRRYPVAPAALALVLSLSTLAHGQGVARYEGEIKTKWLSDGGPYEGRYRDASVIHDFYCEPENRTERWLAVHRMFYQAMLTSGVTQSRALIYYGAVYRHGPRWPDPPRKGRGGGAAASPIDEPPPPPPPPQTSTPIEEDVRMLEEKVANGTITSPEDIERLPD